MNTEKERIYNILKERGESGVTNVELEEMVTWRFASPIIQLRDEGHMILTESLGEGVHRYTLKDVFLAVQDTRDGIEIVEEALYQKYGSLDIPIPKEVLMEDFKSILEENELIVDFIH